MNKRTWNTYATYGYSYDVANDQASAGGVHNHQVRKTQNGGWQERIRQSNCGSASYGPVTAISDADGEAHFATAEQET